MALAYDGLTKELGKKRREDPAAYARLYRERNKERLNAYQRQYYHGVVKQDSKKHAKKLSHGTWSRRYRKYGVSRLLYLEALQLQMGKCMICNTEAGMDLRVDHCHETGKFRGLLCNSCNNGLGRFKDNPEHLRRAARYLEGELIPCHGSSMRRPELIEITP